MSKFSIYRIIPALAFLFLLFSLASCQQVTHPDTVPGISDLPDVEVTDKGHEETVEGEGPEKGKVEIFSGRSGTQERDKFTGLKKEFSGSTCFRYSVDDGTAPKCCWVQLFWVTGVATAINDKQILLSNKISKDYDASPTGTMEVQITKDDTNPIIYVDSVDKFICYGYRNDAKTGDSGFTKRGHVEMWDTPNLTNPLRDLIETWKKNPAFNKLKRVALTTHFDTFLACDGEIVWHLNWESVTAWDKATDQYTVNNRFISADKEGLSSDQKKAVKAFSPDQTVIKLD